MKLLGKIYPTLSKVSTEESVFPEVTELTLVIKLKEGDRCNSFIGGFSIILQLLILTDINNEQLVSVTALSTQSQKNAPEFQVNLLLAERQHMSSKMVFLEHGSRKIDVVVMSRVFYYLPFKRLLLLKIVLLQVASRKPEIWSTKYCLNFNLKQVAINETGNA